MSSANAEVVQETPQTTAVPTQETKPAESKPEPAKAETKTETLVTAEQKPVVPEKYELKLPENSPLKADAIERISTLAKEKGLSNEQAQGLLDAESGTVLSYVEAQKSQVKTITEGWVNELKSDKELGGEHFNQSVEMAKRVVDRFGTDAFKKALNETGLGNHPELVRAFARIGKSMAEDQLVIGNQQNPKAKKSIESVFYGDKTKE